MNEDVSPIKKLWFSIAMLLYQRVFKYMESKNLCFPYMDPERTIVYSPRSMNGYVLMVNGSVNIVSFMDPPGR